MEFWSRTSQLQYMATFTVLSYWIYSAMCCERFSFIFVACFNTDLYSAHPVWEYLFALHWPYTTKTDRKMIPKPLPDTRMPQIMANCCSVLLQIALLLLRGVIIAMEQLRLRILSEIMLWNWELWLIRLPINTSASKGILSRGLKHMSRILVRSHILCVPEDVMRLGRLIAWGAMRAREADRSFAWLWWTLSHAGCCSLLSPLWGRASGNRLSLS